MTNKSLTDEGKRPYPNVVPNRGRWEARRPSNGSYRYIGIFDTPEQARRAVLIAQAEHLEARAAAYRAEADQFAANPTVATQGGEENNV